MNIPKELYYSKNDEWVKVEGNTALIGITDYAQHQLSDIVFVEIIVAVGEKINQGDVCTTLESVKAADVYSPISGNVIEINEKLPDTPELVNSEPFGNAWMVKLEMTNPAELSALMDAKAYESQLQSKE
jgi:glycine cleavage system H protein